jgi:hypothetical protein
VRAAQLQGAVRWLDRATGCSLDYFYLLAFDFPSAEQRPVPVGCGTVLVFIQLVFGLVLPHTVVWMWELRERLAFLNRHSGNHLAEYTAFHALKESLNAVVLAVVGVLGTCLFWKQISITAPVQGVCFA